MNMNRMKEYCQALVGSFRRYLWADQIQLLIVHEFIIEQGFNEDQSKLVKNMYLITFSEEEDSVKDQLDADKL